MLKAKINNTQEHTIEFNSNHSGIIDGKDFSMDILKVKDGSFHILKDNKSYNAEVLQTNEKEKTFVISINGNKYTVELKDKYDELLKSLGMDTMNSRKVLSDSRQARELVDNVLIHSAFGQRF